MSIGGVTAASSAFLVGATQTKRASQTDEVCEYNGHTYFKKDEEFFAQAYGKKLKWPVTKSHGLVPEAQAMTHMFHELAYKSGQSFDTGKYVQNMSRWNPDIFGTDLVNKAASYFGGSASRDGHTTLWA